MPERALHGAESTCADPGDLLALLGTRGHPVFYWEQPSRGLAIAAVGAVREIRAAGAERFAVGARGARTLLASIAARGSWSGAHVVGGFGFSDADAGGGEWRAFPALRLVVPPTAL